MSITYSCSPYKNGLSSFDSGIIAGEWTMLEIV